MSEATQAERIATMDRLRAAGMLPRYRFNLPRATSPLKDRQALDAWLRSVFGRRSCNTHRVRTKDRINWKLLKQVEKGRRPAMRGGPNRIYWRAHNAYLGLEQ